MKITLIKQRLKYWLLVSARYSFVPKKGKAAPVIIMMLDNTMLHGGLLDRLNGIISAKIIAAELSYDFKIYINEQSFPLFKFLKLRNAGIAAERGDLLFNIWQSRPVVYYNIFGRTRQEILQLFKRNQLQYHLYCNVDLLKVFYPQLSQNEITEKWRFHFNDLFCFSKDFIASRNHLFSDKNIHGVHLRFQSLLGDASEKAIVLPAAERELLIGRCIFHIRNIIAGGETNQWLIVSDSAIFLHVLQAETWVRELPGIQILDGAVAHIDFVHDEEVLKKTILDFFLLSSCPIITQVLAKGMYNSQFSKYAAVLGDSNYRLEKI